MSIRYSHWLLLLFFSLMVLPSISNCKVTDNIQTLILPVTSQQFSHYYDMEQQPVNFEMGYLLPEYQAFTVPFSPSESAVPVKGENWGANVVNPKLKYYEAGRFNVKNITYKVLIYYQIGEADTQMLNMQLSSYDKQGHPLDAVLLDNRYSYEGIFHYMNFIIEPNQISVQHYVIDYYDEDENGIGEQLERPVTWLYGKERYGIKNGYFPMLEKVRFDRDGSQTTFD